MCMPTHVRVKQPTKQPCYLMIQDIIESNPGRICNIRFTQNVCHKLNLKYIFQTLLHSDFSSEDIEAARESIACEIEMFKMGADQEPIVTDLVHAAAYNNNTR